MEYKVYRGIGVYGGDKFVLKRGSHVRSLRANLAEMSEALSDSFLYY